ncbi:TetR/AcrR family transcriptional regulator [Actinomadura rudentiformis]|uniref:TetR/AcrR family transcriptional regulator n=1 Tax=Actinomadura rudentiformis TaxID=359158 RepID=A0A6H9YC50_9ACTN|nr:TetR/AcrR family transcriptional regulator [Actinomadura rudentiformis]KAB2341014.1 TetR/AcrR family transcriptional regulator [Actinomadura rudentiformis]
MQRADARRNRERLVTAARETFAEEGPDASLNEIARRAGVGPGTLYRHFPNRESLLTAVLRDRVVTLCGRADELVESASPDEAFSAWLRAFLRHARTDHGLTGYLMIEKPPDLGFDCHQAIRDAAAQVLERAQREGSVRADLTAGDLLQLITGIALATAADDAQADRLLAVVLDGFHSG